MVAFRSEKANRAKYMQCELFIADETVDPKLNNDSSFERKSRWVRKPRSRNYLEPSQVDKLLDAAKQSGKQWVRNWTMLYMTYKHGLRVSELCEMKWEQINFDETRITMARKKKGTSMPHRLDGEETKLLKRLKRENEKIKKSSPYIFLPLHKASKHMSRRNVYDLVSLFGIKAGLDIPVNPHMLRHACGHRLAKQKATTRHIQDYLGHKCISHTVTYTRLNDEDVIDLW